VRRPGAGGAPEIATAAKEVTIIVKQSQRTFVEKLDFVTSSGYAAHSNRKSASLPAGRGATTVITDRAIFRSDPETRELVLTSLHPGVSLQQARQASGWSLREAANVAVTPAPTGAELTALRDLHARTAAAHRGLASVE